MRSPKRGFTLPEVLISIAILAIGFVGALSALSFGLFSTDQAQQQAFATAYCKKVIEVVNSGSVQMSDPAFTHHTPLTLTNINTPGDPVWGRLDAAPFNTSVTNLWGDPAAPINSPQRFENQQWVHESPRYQSAVVTTNCTAPDGTQVNGYTAAPANDKFMANLQQFTVYVRWNKNSNFYSVQLATYIVVPAQP